METNKIGILIKKSSLEFDNITNPMLVPFALTPAQFKTLKFLYSKQDQPIRQVDIERFFSMKNPTVTGILQNLEKSGWIMRETNPEDGRSKVILLTQKAQETKPELDKIWEQLEQQMTRNLDVEEQQQLICLLIKMLGL